MKMTLRIVMTGILAVFLVSGTAGAVTYTFYDNTINWPGWTPWYTQDQIGEPDVFNPPVVAMSVTVDDASNSLLSVVIHMDGRQGIVDEWINGDNGAASFDALFINAGGPYQAWNYYVEDITNDNATGATLYGVAGGYTYKLATQPYAGLNGRWGHPAGIDTGITPISGLLGVVGDENADTLTYTFAPRTIVLGQGFQIGYSQWCANDVILTPEPGVMLLLGFGLVGVAVLRRKFNK